MRQTPAVLSPEGERVRLSQAGAVAECEYLGNFASGYGARPVWGPWASNQVRNGAAERGATDVVLE